VAGPRTGDAVRIVDFAQIEKFVDTLI